MTGCFIQGWMKDKHKTKEYRDEWGGQILFVFLKASAVNDQIKMKQKTGKKKYM